MQSPEGPSEAQWDVSWLDDTAVSLSMATHGLSEAAP